MYGGFAHELGHISKELMLKKEQTLMDKMIYRRSKTYKTLDERNTDLQTILRGYGPQLLSLLIYNEEKGFPHYKENGLSIREVSLLLSLGR